ncbi:hypothetical protein H1R20_g6697, partial [Candolleomyces eurysporus]
MASDDDRGSSDSRLKEINQQKALLIQEREQLEAQIRGLDYRIACLSKEYGKIHNATQPISKIPPDLLHTIFHLFRASSDGRTVDGSIPIGTALRRRPEVTLSVVCAQWRHACLSFGDLWNTFRTRRPSERSHERLVAVLQRSGSHPLDLWFDFREVGFHDLPDRFHLLQDCLKHVHRWRKFTIVTDVESPIHYLSERLVEAQAPLLERLTLLPNRAYEFDEVIMTTDEPVTLAGGTPKLKYLCLNDLSAAMFTPSLSTITDLRLDMTEGIENYWIKWEVFLHILQLPSLTTLSIVGQPFTVPISHAVLKANDEFKAFPIIHMPNLQHLRHASLLATGFVDLILPNLRAPNLLTLTLKDLNMPSDKQLYWANNTNLEPFPKLHTLVLIDFEFLNSTNVTATFNFHLSRLTSNIKTLVISDGCEALSTNQYRVNPSNPFTSGWKNIKTLALNVRTSMFQNTERLRTFVRVREQLETVWLSQAFMIFWPHEHPAASCRVLGWTRKEEVSECLGPVWPPGSRDNDGVDDPVSFDLFD